MSKLLFTGILAAFLSLASVAAGAVITGNTGPGGFERTNTPSTLVIWLKAGTIAGIDNSAVGTWTNSASSGGNISAGSNATQGTATRQPTLQNGAGDLLNGNPVLRFDGTDDYLNGSVAVGGPKTFFLVVKDTGTVGTCCSGGIGTRTSGNSNWNGLMSVNSGGTVKLFGDRSSAGLTGNASILNTPVVGSLTYETTGTKMYLNGVVDASNSSNYQFTGTSYQVGTRNNEISRYFRGDMAENAVFNRVLNTAERTVVENYLSAKYGVGLSAGDHYAGDQLVNGDYDLDVFGIGRVDASNQLASAGQSGFGIEAAGGTLGDGEWTLAGHKVAGNSLVNIEGYASGDRWDRVWYVDVTGSLDTTFAFDFSDGGLAAPTLGDQYSLLFSPTNAFAWQTVGPGGISGDLVTFSLTGLTGSNNGYYTLGVNAINAVDVVTPEPSAFLIWSLGLLGLIALRRRRKR